MSTFKPPRRVALTVLGSGVALPLTSERRPAAAAWPPRTLDAAAFGLLDALTERLIPADEDAPGAREAAVAAYIDSELALNRERAAQYQRGLAAVDAQARTQLGTPFMALSPQQQDQVLERLAASEAQPRDDAERFFVVAKQDTIRAYYTSEIGILQALGYKGNRGRSHFDGCQHESHAADGGGD